MRATRRLGLGWAKAVTRAALLLCGGILSGSLSSGCGRAAFPQDLFTVGVDGADYPFMLSQVPKAQAPRRGARPLHAESGTHSAVQQSSYAVGNTTVTVTQTESGRSELSAAVKLAAQVQRKDRWVAFERAKWTATDFSTYGASSADRLLSVEASAYRQEGNAP